MMTRDLEYATLIYASGSYLRDLLGYIFLLELRRDINGTVSVSRLGLYNCFTKSHHNFVKYKGVLDVKW